MKYFVTAINTNSGKTVVAAILCEALKADYWKPIQSGDAERDAETVKSLISNTTTIIHPERHLLHTPCSPHQAAELDGVQVKLSDFELPKTKNPNIIIEGVGGVMVPLNYEGDYVIDLAKKFEAEIILVSNIYLGSINHTLLTVNELRRRWPYIKYIVFNGPSNPATETVILKHTGLKLLAHIPHVETITPEWVRSQAERIAATWSF